MNYFDDLRIVRLLHHNSNANPGLNPSMYHTIGLMQGTKGAIMCTPERDVFVKTPFLYWIPPDKICAWHTPPGGRRDNYWISMEGPRASRLVSSLLELEPDGVMPVGSPATYVQTFMRFKDLLRQNTPATSYRLALLLEELAATIYDLHLAESGSTRIFKAVSDLAQQMRHSPARRYDYRSIAAGHGFSYEHFREKFKEYIGVPPHQYLISLRLERATMLLLEGECSIKEITARCGFDSSSNFARFFRLHTNYTPSQYAHVNKKESV